MQRSFKLQGQTLLSKKLAGSITGMNSFKAASTSMKVKKLGQKRTVNFFTDADSNDALSGGGPKSNTSSYYGNKKSTSILKNVVRQKSDLGPSPPKKIGHKDFELSSISSSNTLADKSYITEESAFSKSQAESRGMPDISTMKLILTNKSLKKLDFLTKFVREFPNIKHIDLGNNAIGNEEMEKFMGALETNDKI